MGELDKCLRELQRIHALRSACPDISQEAGEMIDGLIQEALVALLGYENNNPFLLLQDDLVRVSKRQLSSAKSRVNTPEGRQDPKKVHYALWAAKAVISSFIREKTAGNAMGMT